MHESFSYKSVLWCLCTVMLIRKCSASFLGHNCRRLGGQNLPSFAHRYLYSTTSQKSLQNMPRRSLRLKGRPPSEASSGKRLNTDEELNVDNGIHKRQRRKEPLHTTYASEASTKHGSLPRTRELAILGNSGNTIVIGVDEAGRGPLAGPVVR